MEVTKDNFLDVYSVMEKAIEEADFIGFDGEFSGLGVEYANFQFDSAEGRYKRLKEGTKGFLMIQVGLCPFIWIEEKQQYEARPFAVYVFPRPFGKFGEDTRFVCQCGSLDFLASHGFDFNKLIHKGVPYMLPPDEIKLRESVSKKYAKLREQMTLNADVIRKQTDGLVTGDSGTIMTPVPLKMKPYVEETCETIRQFVEDPTGANSLDLPTASGFKRKLIFEAVENRFPNGIYLETCSSNKGQWIRVCRGNAKKKKESMENKKNQEEAEIDLAIGFSNVMRKLQKSEKLIIGHNMLLDVMLSINQFFSPLPEDLDEFKTLVQTVYPKLIDTKLMASTSPLKEEIMSTVLSELVSRVRKEPFEDQEIEFPEDFKLYNDLEQSYHDAGYDAYVTGRCFLAMAKHLSTLQKSNAADVVSGRIEVEIPILQPFLNKINVTRLHEIPYINMKGSDPNPSRDYVFYLQCNPTWVTSNVIKLFAKYGFVYVSWISDTSALIALDKEEKAKTVIRDLVQPGRRNDYRVLTFAQYCGMEPENKYTSTINTSDKRKTRKRRRSKQNGSNNEATPSESKTVKTEDGKEKEELEEGEISDSDSNASDREPPAGHPTHPKGEFQVPKDW